MSGIMSMVLGAKTAIAAAVDAYFNLVTLLLPGDGTNGAQNNTFLDSSTNNFTITRNGNTTQGTFSPFSQTGWSNYFDGSSASLTYPNNTAFAFGTGAFTIEFWIHAPSNSDKFILGGRSAIGTMHITTGGAAGSTTGSLRYVGSSTITTSSTLITNNSWNHCAIVRDGSNNITLYVNGVSAGTGTDTTNYTTTSGTWYIGQNDLGNSNYLQGYISNLRILKGTALYTGSFTPPTAPLTAITNTSLLTCQSNRFIDNSSNAFAITVNGTPSVQPFSPFAPTAAYSAATNGGSGYFDGAGDYVTVPNNTAFNQTADFSEDCWVYFTGNPANGNYQYFACADGNPYFQIGVTGSGYFVFAKGYYPDLITSNGQAGVAKQGQWYHVVITRQSNTCRLFVNGVLQGTATDSSSTTISTGPFYLGQLSTVYPFTGYMSNFRFVRGGVPSLFSTSSTTAGATIFTPPTAPYTGSESLTAGSVSLLTNFTNAGITDATAKNDLETVGNAQISTTQSKFGGSSMYFDGTGDYLLIPSSNVNRPLFDFGSGNWTVEFWVNWTTAPSATTEFRLWWSSVRSTGVARLDLYIYNNIVYAGWSGTNVLDSGSLSWNTGQWYHMAFVRSGNSWAAFRDGTRIASATNSTTLVSSPAKIIGENVNAYIDDFRVTTGYARYDPSQTTVTIPTSAFGLQ